MLDGAIIGVSVACISIGFLGWNVPFSWLAFVLGLPFLAAGIGFLRADLYR